MRKLLNHRTLKESQMSDVTVHPPTHHQTRTESGPWRIAALTASLSSVAALVLVPASPWASIGLAVLGLTLGLVKRTGPGGRVASGTAIGLAAVVLLIHLVVGLSWAGTTVSG